MKNIMQLENHREFIRRGWLILVPLVVGLSLASWFFGRLRLGPSGYADSEDLALAIFHNTLAHPPGYPLMVSFYRTFLDGMRGIGLLWVEVEYIHVLVNIATAILVYGVVYLLGKRLNRKPLFQVMAGIGAMVAFILATSTYTHTVKLEVFGLAQLITVSCWLIWLLICQNIWVKRLALVLGILATLGILYHPLSLLVTVPLVTERIMMWLLFKKNWRLLAFLVTGCVAGLFLTLIGYMQLESLGATEPYRWPIETDWVGVWSFFWRLDYAPDGSAIEMYRHEWNWLLAAESIITWAKLFVLDIGVPALLLMLVGLLSLKQKNKRVLALLLLGFLLSGPVVAGYLLYPRWHTATDTEYYWGSQLTNRMHYNTILLGSILAGLGMGTLLLHKRRSIQVIGFVGMFLLVHKGLVLPEMDTFYERLFAQEIAPLPAQSVVFVGNDLIFPLLYSQDVAGLRKDLLIVPIRLYLRDEVIKQEVGLPYVFDEVDSETRVAHLTRWAQENGREVFALGAEAQLLEILAYEGGPYRACPHGVLLRITRHECTDQTEAFLLSVRKLEHDWDKGFRGWLAETYAIQAYYARTERLEKQRVLYEIAALEMAQLPTTRQTVEQVLASNVNLEHRTRLLDLANLLDRAKEELRAGDLAEAEWLVHRGVTKEPRNKQVRELWLEIAKARNDLDLQARIERYLALYSL